MAGGRGWGPAQGMVRWNGLLILQEDPLLPCPAQLSTPLAVALRAGPMQRKQLTLGAASSLGLVRSESSDRGPVPPLPFSQVVLKPRLAGSESGGSLGPCPPCHSITLQAWHLPALAQAKRGSHSPGQEG